MKAFLFVVTALMSSVAIAGGGHYHPKKIATCSSKECTPAEIEAAVPKAIPELANWKKIDSVWSSAKIESVGKKEFKKGPEWVATLVNDKSEKRYIFFTLDGYVTGSNSTGN